MHVKSLVNHLDVRCHWRSHAIIIWTYCLGRRTFLIISDSLWHNLNFICGVLQIFKFLVLFLDWGLSSLVAVRAVVDDLFLAP